MKKAFQFLKYVCAAILFAFTGTATSQVTHSYNFQGNFAEGGGIGSALTEVLSCSATNGSFTSQNIVTNAVTCGSAQQVFAFNSGGGVSYTNRSVIEGTYTINIFFKFNTGMPSGYKRIIDFKNSTADAGLYINGGSLNFYPSGNQGTSNYFVADTYYLITLVRNAATNIVNVYVNGAPFVIDYNDASGDYVPASPTTPIILFRDDNIAPCENASGAIRYLSLKPVVSTDAEVLSTWTNICNIASCVPPVITCPGSVSVNADAGQCLAKVTYPEATATGATGSITYTQNSGTYFPIGTTTVTATASNGVCSSSCSFAVTVNGSGGGAAGEIDVKGNNVSIPSDDMTPSTADHTNFGSVNVGSSFARTFTIYNTGGSPLNIQSITVSGINQSEFIVGDITLPASIASAGNITFTVTLTPVAVDVRSAIIQISNNDCNESNYTYAIQGNGLQPTVTNPTSIISNYNPICNGASAILTANGADGTVYWYTGSCGGTATSPATGNTLTVSPSVSTTYYARNYNNSQFSEGCASIDVIVNPRPTVADLQATGTGIKWYLTPTGGEALESTTELINNTHYYASQTINGIESTDRFDVLVTLTNP